MTLPIYDTREYIRDNFDLLSDQYSASHVEVLNSAHSYAAFRASFLWSVDASSAGDAVLQERVFISEPVTGTTIRSYILRT